MKPMQWIIGVVVLVLMVFAVTIVMNFLGDNSGTTATTAPSPQNSDPVLAFVETSYPSGTAYHDQEFNHEGGQHDYVFENDKDEEVTVGLNSLSCHCASVSLFLASNNSEWKANKARWTAGEAGKPALNPLLAVDLAKPTDQGLETAAAKIEPTGVFEPDKKKDATFTIPPRAVGWFRVTWPGDKDGTSTYKAELAIKTPTKQGGVILEAKVRWVNPAYVVDKIHRVGDFKATDLDKKPVVTELFVFSATRPQLHPSSTLVTKWKTDESPIEVGEPKYLPPPYDWLINRLQHPEPGQEALVLDRIKCVYRIPVTYKAISPDKTRPLPLGMFRTRVRIEFADVNIEPLVSLLHGTVQGNVSVGGEGKLDFSTFPEELGTKRDKVILYTESDDVVLELDKEHTWPRLLNDDLKLVQDKEEKKEWTLSAKLPPHSGVHGRFPREDDDEYFDTAVYVKIKGDKTRSLRIPSGGTAN